MDKRQKRRRKKNKVKFGNRKHTIRGIISIVLAVLSFVLFWALVIVSYNMNGNGGIYMGTIGITALFMNVVGVFNAIKSFQERDRNYLFSKLGIMVNLVMILGWSGIYVLGM